MEGGDTEDATWAAAAHAVATRTCLDLLVCGPVGAPRAAAVEAAAGAAVRGGGGPVARSDCFADRTTDSGAVADELARFEAAFRAATAGACFVIEDVDEMSTAAQEAVALVLEQRRRQQQQQQQQQQQRRCRAPQLVRLVATCADPARVAWRLASHLVAVHVLPGGTGGRRPPPPRAAVELVDAATSFAGALAAIDAARARGSLPAAAALVRGIGGVAVDARARGALAADAFLDIACDAALLEARLARGVAGAAPHLPEVARIAARLHQQQLLRRAGSWM